MSHDGLYLNSDAASTLEIIEVPEIPTAVVSFSNLPRSEMSAAFDVTFKALIPTLVQRGNYPQGPGFALYHQMPTDTFTFEIGIGVQTPLTEQVATEYEVTVEPSVIPAGPVSRISHIGSFEELPKAWENFIAAIAAAGRTVAFPFWEVYVTRPTPDMDPATLRTDLYIALQP
ncbi:GyrI-like domain-containing protein [Corynebacterium callunae]|uniref:GyrI-like domain-containing protein n=1 Tax=Corynebacterium callunae TaxID=1721 RepID=UPI003981CA90